MSREVRKFADTFKNLPAYSGLHFGEVVSIDSSPAYTLTVRVDGETGSGSNVSGVRYLATCYPEPGSLVVLQRYGRDLIAVNSVAGKGGAAPAARVYKTGDQALTTTAATQVTYASVWHDPWGMFDNANDELIAPLDGVYLGSVTIVFSGLAATNVCSCFLRVMSADRSTQIQQSVGRVVSASTGNVWFTVTDLFPMSKGERLRVVAQSNVTTTTVSQSGESAGFSLSYLGPDA